MREQGDFFSPWRDSLGLGAGGIGAGAGVGVGIVASSIMSIFSRGARISARKYTFRDLGLGLGFARGTRVSQILNYHSRIVTRYDGQILRIVLMY